MNLPTQPSTNWSCRIGAQTILWGEHFHDIDKTLAYIKSLGFQGVEFAQIPAYLGTKPVTWQNLDKHLGDPSHLEFLLNKHGLTLLGLSGGTLATRVKFCERLKTKPLYLYIEAWDDYAAHVAEQYTLALHPHLFKTVERFNEALSLLEKHDRLKLLPDTAHLFLAGADFMKVLESAKGRVIAVHLKDWTQKYGWSRVMYARGFRELGQGVLPHLSAVWDWLKTNFDGWVIAEQDSTDYTPEASLELSRRWLSEPQAKHIPPLSLPSPPSEPCSPLLRQSERMLRSVDVLAKDCLMGINRLYASILKCCVELFNAECASLWEVNSRTDFMSLQAFWPIGNASVIPSIREMKLSDATSGCAISERIVTVTHNLPSLARSGAFRDRRIVEVYNVDTMISVPVGNLFNMNSPELLLNIFTKAFPPTVELDEVHEFLHHVSIAVNHAWQSLRTDVLEDFNYITESNSTTQQLLQSSLTNIRSSLGTRAVSIFLVSPTQMALELKATTGFVPATAMRNVSYAKGDGVPGRAWLDREEINLADSRDVQSADQRPWEFIAQECTPALLTPIYRMNRAGEVLGLIRCLGKEDDSVLHRHSFSVSDEIILDAIQSALSPVLERWVTTERRLFAMTRIAHELRVPIMYTIGAVERMKLELQRAHWDFSKDYLGDVQGYMELMNGVVDNTGFLKPITASTLDRTWVRLLPDILAPAKSQVSMLLAEKGFSSDQITYHVPEKFPGMFLDKPRFQQVVFNLLSNAIKYARPSGAEFRVRIVAKVEPNRCEIVFRDWGVGVEPGMAEVIFKEGVRGPNACRLHVSGDGFGLWLVREILSAHGASIGVTRSWQPTEFTVVLPSILQQLPKTVKTRNA